MLKRIAPILAVGVALLFAAIGVYASVELEYLDGNWTSNGSLIFWGTQDEQDSAGFYVWRSTEDLQLVGGALNTSQALRVSGYIPGVGGGCTTDGDDYDYLDTSADPNEDVYYYFLESLNCNSGGSVFYGNGGSIEGSGVMIEPGSISVYLPLVSR